MNGAEKIVTDPYAIASDATENYNYVVDRAKFSADASTISPFPATRATPSSMKRVSATSRPIRSSTLRIPANTSVSSNRGLKTPAGHPAGIDYLAGLGVTHVQLMPFFDFDGVDERHPEAEYNWGYNPKQYNVPEGSYATDPDDPYARINELRTAIDGLHARNIGVVMDVVFNHVFDQLGFPFEKLVPGYAYLVDRQGIYTNVSGCKNDLATHRKMVRKLIIDSVLFWAGEYKVDGFRFDLMGLIDVETMNELRQELHDLDERIIVYGEGWKMYSSNQADRMAHMMNKNVIYTIGFFNDRFRETIKGKTFEPTAAGYATGDFEAIETVREVLLGSAANRYLFKYASQSVNYVECHDNLTFFDKCLTMTDDVARIKRQEKLATAMVLLAQGMPFIHAGQEFFRTKGGDENSYESSDAVNRIDWTRADENGDAIEFFRALTAFRRANPGFKLKASSDLVAETEVIVLKSQSILYSLNGGTAVLILFKPTDDPETVIVPEDYRLVLASEPGHRMLSESAYELSGIGAYLFQKRDEGHEL